MPDERNRIEVLGEHEEDQAAIGVHFHASIEGSSFFTGRAALSKAKELAALGMEVQQHRKVKCEVRLSFAVGAFERRS